MVVGQDDEDLHGRLKGVDVVSRPVNQALNALTHAHCGAPAELSLRARTVAHIDTLITRAPVGKASGLDLPSDRLAEQGLEILPDGDSAIRPASNVVDLSRGP